MRKVLMIASLLLLAACTDAHGASEAVRNNGLEPVKVGGYDPFACSKGDTFSTKFVAQRPDGKLVRGVVCAGFLKGSTVRFK